MDELHISVGNQTSTIPVRISYRIIELFSEGLYASPNKAVEELVSNAFDAGAMNVHVILSPDRAADDAFLVVIDDGTSMNAKELANLWLIGISKKRQLASNQLPRGRKQIGKFGIGKLATFVLAQYLTHFCKRDGKFYAASMDYSKIPRGEEGGIHTEELVQIPLRELTEAQARQALEPFVAGTQPGHKTIKLFGNIAANTWTVSLLSKLKPMATEIKKGRLAWVLRTAMPLRDDFNIFLDGKKLLSSKADAKRLKQWVIGKNLIELSRPAPADLEVTKANLGAQEHRFGLTHPLLGRVTGYAELYDDFLTTGKSSEWGRSHGFFVYVRGRLINEDEPLFGIPPLRHGTFARFRMVAHIDRLDDELRSSRESVRSGPLVTLARQLVQGVFNQVRNWDKENQEAQSADVRATGRIADSPGSLTRRPFLALTQSVFDGKAAPEYTLIDPNLQQHEKDALIKTLRARAESDQGLVLKAELVDLAQDAGIAQFDLGAGSLSINTLHPFVTAHGDDHGMSKDTLILLAMAEVLTEARLYELGLEAKQVRDIIRYRDELLRQFARSTKKRSAAAIAQALEDAASDKDKLETELVASFQSLGFNAIRLSGKKRPDGQAQAHLSAQDGQKRRYAVSLEAKSKEDATKKVTAKAVDVAAIIQHRDDFNCDHAIVAAPQFPVGKNSNLVKQAQADKENTGRTITYLRIYDLARLVRIAPLKCLGLDRLRDLFQSCVSAEEASEWIDKISSEIPVQRPPFEKILETIWTLQEKRAFESVEYSSVATQLHSNHEIVLKKDEVIALCRAMSMMAPQVVATETTVELTQTPQQIIETFKAAVSSMSERDSTSFFTI